MQYTQYLRSQRRGHLDLIAAAPLRHVDRRIRPRDEPHGLRQCNGGAGARRVEIGLCLLRRVHHHLRYAPRRCTGLRKA